MFKNKNIKNSTQFIFFSKNLITSDKCIQILIINRLKEQRDRYIDLPCCAFMQDGDNKRRGYCLSSLEDVIPVCPVSNGE